MSGLSTTWQLSTVRLETPSLMKVYVFGGKGKGVAGNFFLLLCCAGIGSYCNAETRLNLWGKKKSCAKLEIVHSV